MNFTLVHQVVKSVLLQLQTVWKLYLTKYLVEYSTYYYLGVVSGTIPKYLAADVHKSNCPVYMCSLVGEREVGNHQSGVDNGGNVVFGS